MALITTMFMLVKLAGESGVALPEIIFWRQAIIIMMLGGWLAATGGIHRLKTRRLGVHARRAVVGTAGMFGNFGAAILLPLAVSTTLSFTTPLFAVILTALFLRDKPGAWRWLAVLIGFIGVLIVTQPGHLPPSALGKGAWLGVAAGLTSGFLVAVISFQVRDLARTEEPISIVFYFALFGTVITGAALPFFITAHTPWQWFLLIATGAVGTIGQLLLTKALRYGSVASIIVMDYTALIWAALYSWLIWEKLPPFTTWLGAPLIFAAGILIAWREHRAGRVAAVRAALAAEGAA